MLVFEHIVLQMYLSIARSYNQPPIAAWWLLLQCTITNAQMPNQLLPKAAIVKLGADPGTMERRKISVMSNSRCHVTSSRQDQSRLWCWWVMTQRGLMWRHRASFCVCRRNRLRPNVYTRTVGFRNRWRLWVRRCLQTWIFYSRSHRFLWIDSFATFSLLSILLTESETYVLREVCAVYPVIK